jgi:hypothetical protein
VQLAVDLRLLQLNLMTLQRRELLEPTQTELRELREGLSRGLLRQPSPRHHRHRYLNLRQDLRLRAAERGHFGALLEPLLRGRGAVATTPTPSGLAAAG